MDYAGEKFEFRIAMNICEFGKVSFSHLKQSDYMMSVDPGTYSGPVSGSASVTGNAMFDASGFVVDNADVSARGDADGNVTVTVDPEFVDAMTESVSVDIDTGFYTITCDPAALGLADTARATALEDACDTEAGKTMNDLAGMVDEKEVTSKTATNQKVDDDNYLYTETKTTYSNGTVQIISDYEDNDKDLEE